MLDRAKGYNKVQKKRDSGPLFFAVLRHGLRRQSTRNSKQDECGDVQIFSPNGGPRVSLHRVRGRPECEAPPVTSWRVPAPLQPVRLLLLPSPRHGTAHTKTSPCSPVCPVGYPTNSTFTIYPSLLLAVYSAYRPPPPSTPINNLSLPPISDFYHHLLLTPPLYQHRPLTPIKIGP